MDQQHIVVMGSYVADLAFRTEKLPAWGETYMGTSFKLGPGGKGSNQAVAAARAGAKVSFISKLANDAFGDLARKTYREEGIDTTHLFETETPTGAAAIIIDAVKGENAIIVVPGACFELTSQDVEQAREMIGKSAVFVTQLELSLPTVEFGLKLAHSLGVPTILNPAPCCKLPDSIYQYCDYMTPNETEVELLTGIHVASLEDAEQAADALLARGVRNAIITLGAQGALVKNATTRQHVPAFNAGAVVETTGAGDAFNGGFAVALAENMDIVQAARFGCAVAGISVTRPGTAPSMPTRKEVDELLK
jgi:ribokinase